MILVIGNKRYSSWSLRPWVLMKHFEIPFEEKLVALDQPSTPQEIVKFSPSGKVPALIDGPTVIWESLAIAEYLNDKYPEKQMWPTSASLRAVARAVSNEMHGGFQAMREHMSHDLQKKLTGFDWSAAKEDVHRVWAIWSECLKKSGGPFLFGAFSIADAMYAPVANRFITYGLPLDATCAGYVRTLRALPAHRLWLEAGEQEQLRMPRYEP